MKQLDRKELIALSESIVAAEDPLNPEGTA